jgi:hypothetical protein
MRNRSAGLGPFAVLAMLALWLAGFILPAARAAEPLARPTGPVVLTVTGAIARTNGPDGADFDQAMLEALGVEHITTTTNWTDGKAVFDGVPVSKVLQAVGATGTSVVASALDEYSIEIPIQHFTRYEVLLAMRMNGRPLPANDKGPLWIVYPRDDHPELRDPSNNAYWVWQLRTIKVR